MPKDPIAFIKTIIKKYPFQRHAGNNEIGAKAIILFAYYQGKQDLPEEERRWVYEFIKKHQKSRSFSYRHIADTFEYLLNNQATRT